MTWTNPKRAAGFGFGAVAMVLAMASVAFACTAYEGKVAVSDIEVVAGVPNMAFADGSGDTHGYCPIQAPASAVTGGYPVRQPVDLTGEFTVAVSETTTCLANTKLNKDGSADYEVRWLNVPATEPLASCMASTDTPLATFTVTKGVGSTTATVPSTFTGPGEVNICVRPKVDPTKNPHGPEVWLFVV